MSPEEFREWAAEEQARSWDRADAERDAMLAREAEQGLDELTRKRRR